MDLERRKAIRITAMFGLSAAVGGFAGHAIAKTMTDDVSKIKQAMNKAPVSEDAKTTVSRRGMFTGSGVGALAYYINT